MSVKYINQLNQTSVWLWLVGGCSTSVFILLFHCLWPLLQLWIGFEGADHQSISDHFIQFIFSIGGLKSRWSFF